MWRYHTIYTIKRYGSLNGLTTETYETLHKNWVKNPYRMTNKKNVLDQMFKTVSFINWFYYKNILFKVLTYLI
jgi:hypothetical protein